jgi:RimJ/RimL family protein N-acetyltransferase
MDITPIPTTSGKPRRSACGSEMRRNAGNGRTVRLIGCSVPSGSARPFPEACDFKGAAETLSFAIESLAGEFVGWANLFVGEGRHGRFSVGMSNFQEHQRMGYAVEAMRLLLLYGFNELRCHKCNSACLDINTASIALHKKLGFVEEGRRREVVYMNGQYQDDVLFGLTEHEYRQQIAATGKVIGYG